ncbi:MAG: sigma-70 family RNA polymerase sigma factor [Staphylococcus sp.]|nr:sigma-70 family RNA polymerase sigma factor [Staphylococcus sp.]
MEPTELIRQCVAGDVAAMTELYRLYSPRMMKLVLHYVSDRSAAEDILHDGFIVIFTHISEVRTSDRLEYWMGTIMKNLAIQYLSRIEMSTLLGEDDDDHPEVPDINDILSYEELEIIINRLPEGYRTIFKLAVFENKSHKEIAGILGIAPHTSSSQLARAKAMLRKMIEERNAALLAILLLLIPAGIIFLLTTGTSDDTPLSMRVDHPVASTATRITSSHTMNTGVIHTGTGPASGQPGSPVMAAATSAPGSVTATGPDSAVVENAIAEVPADTVTAAVPAEGRPQARPVDMGNVGNTRRHTASSTRRGSTRNKGSWSVGVNYSMNMSARHGQGFHSDNSYAADMLPDSMKLSRGSTVIKDGFKQTITHKLPVTVGININKNLTPRLGIETGVSFTYLRSSITYRELDLGLVNATRDVSSYFIGIPLKLNYRIFDYGRFSVYGTAGLALDIPVGTDVKTAHFGELRNYPTLENRLQMSVSVGAGFEYRLVRGLSLYVEPSVRYYPSNGSSLPTIRQDQPFEFTLPLGLRFNL